MSEEKVVVGSAPHLRWGVLGCGVIANEMAQALQLQGRTICGVANRTHEKAVAYAERYGIPKVYDQIDDLFADPDIDAVYITTPHNTHITFLRKALAAGKHVMCEKAITLNSDELEEAIALARESGVVLMDACTELHMPLYKELVRRTRAGEFGTVNLVQENFGSFKEYDERNRFFNPNLAGGAMLDIGIYSLTLMRLFMESMPKEQLSLMNPAPTGVDMTSGLLLRNAEGQVGVISLTLHSKQPKRAVVSADKAYIEIMEYPRADEATVVWTETGEAEVVRAGERRLALCYVLADLEAAVAGDAEARAQMDVTVDVMRMMTDFRRSWDFYYPEEKRDELRELVSAVDKGSKAREGAPGAHPEMDRLVRTIWRLRQPDGCPWDRVQTHESIRANMIEEAYEAVETIDRNDDEHLLEELGDVLEQVLLHAQIAEDRGTFGIDDIARGLNEKLVRRHPHVFGAASAGNAEEALDAWDAVKRDERSGAADEVPQGLLDSIPRAMPALMQCQKISKRAAKAGFEWETTADVWDKVAEERAEFEREEQGSEAAAAEFGDLLFALVNVARKEGIDAEEALRASNEKFRRRWALVEAEARRRGLDVAELDTDEMNRIWDSVKAGE